MDKRKLAIILCIISAVSLIIFFAKRNSLYISNANKNMNMGEFKLLMKLEDVKTVLDKDFMLNHGFGCSEYENVSEGIAIEFSGYPDVLDKFQLTRIETTNPKYSIYGISTGQSFDDAVKQLKRRGFLQFEKTHSYKKGRLTIALTPNTNGKIESIFIGLYSTNKKHVIF